MKLYCAHPNTFPVLSYDDELGQVVILVCKLCGLRWRENEVPPKKEIGYLEEKS